MIETREKYKNEKIGAVGRNLTTTVRCNLLFLP